MSVHPEKSDSVVLVYTSNNSGGGWWLDDHDWRKLAEAGWNVFWRGDDDRSPYSDDQEELLAPFPETGERWLGALATAAAKRVPSAREGVAEWELLTGENAAAIGCNCCGNPHQFRFVDASGDDHYVLLADVTTTALEYPEGF